MLKLFDKLCRMCVILLFKVGVGHCGRYCCHLRPKVRQAWISVVLDGNHRNQYFNAFWNMGCHRLDYLLSGFCPSKYFFHINQGTIIFV